MRIIYFTTSQEEKDYRSFITQWKISLNSSNQNFHNKLIRSLAINNQIDVISIRPFSRSKTKVSHLKKDTKVDGNITWHYLKRSGGRIWRLLSINPQVNKIMKSLDLNDSIIITDTINTSIAKTVTKINKKYHLPVIGVCTDSPSNISGTSKSYTLHLLEEAKLHSGYLALTAGLNNLFNPENKPNLVFEGIVEDRTFDKPKECKKPYFFFGGALMEKYGVFNLIKAFKDLNRNDIDLYICGHHGDKQRLKEEIGKANNIKFLGLLPMNKVMEYEAYSLASINPRPFSEDLDRFSIPSKTLEYMASGRPVISVRNTILMEKFPKEIIWINSHEVSDIKDALKKVLQMNEADREKYGKESKNRVLELYSIESISKTIQPFLEQFVK